MFQEKNIFWEVVFIVVLVSVWRMDFLYYIDRSPFTITTIMHVDDYNVSGPDVAKVYITTGSKGED